MAVAMRVVDEPVSKLAVLTIKGTVVMKRVCVRK